MAAEVLGRPITLAEVDERIRDDLVAVRTRGRPEALHELRYETLRRMIEERLAEDEAARRRLSLERVKQERAQRRPRVSDEEVLAFWKEHRDRLGDYGFEVMAPQVRRALERQRASEPSEQPGVAILLAPPGIAADATGPSRGSPTAPVVIVEFADFQCPHCKRSLETLERVFERHPEEVRLVFRHLPITDLHPRARAAAEAAACADAQGAFWAYHDRLFASRGSLDREELMAHARALDLDGIAFERCIDAREQRATIDTDLAAARALSLDGTPSFVVNGTVLRGARPAEDFFRVIDRALGEASPGGN